MKVVIFGATGSAGGSVLRAALAAGDVDEVRAFVRRPLTLSHPKLTVVNHGNFLDFTGAASAFDNIDACFFCLGVSSAQVRKEDDYRRITHDFAVAAAEMLKRRSPNASFHFISGASTSASSRWMWARVKAQTEHDLRDLVGSNAFRPGAIYGEPSNSGTWYAPLRPLFKVFAPFRGLYIDGADLGRAMLQAAREKMRGQTFENRDIRDLADRAR
jgi:uncharacterized protein YbjT (DUF2867 family)